MKRLILCLVLLLQLGPVASAAECTMKPAPIDVIRIKNQLGVKSYVIDRDKHSLTVLLKDGRAFKLVHMGCDHSGAQASLWFDSSSALSDSKLWLKESMSFARIVFTPGIASDIVNSLKNGKFDTTTEESSVTMIGSANEYMTYSIVVSLTEHGVLLTISYSLG